MYQLKEQSVKTMRANIILYFRDLSKFEYLKSPNSFRASLNQVPLREIEYPSDIRHTGCSLNIVFFSLKFWTFLNSASSAASAGLLPALCVNTRHRGRTEKGQSPEYFKISGKKTQY